MEKIDIGILVGSLRKGSLNRKVALKLADFLPAHFNAHCIEIGDLALYNQDLDTEAALPAPWKRFREEAGAMQGYLFVTPEYNRSMPAALKNALDIGSRPPSQNLWDGKPAGLISVSPGKMGGFGSSNHLRQSMVCLNLNVMPQPEAYIGGILASMDKAGEITDEKTLAFLQKLADAFVAWVERCRKA